MTDTKARMNGRKALPELIANEISSEINRRFLTRMPAFRPAGELPDRFEALLGELERAEVRSRGASGS